MGIEFIAAIAIVTLAGVVSGLVGFGFALVCVPPLLLIYDPPVAITVSVGLTLPTGWVILIGVWRQTFGDKGSGRCATGKRTSFERILRVPRPTMRRSGVYPTRSRTPLAPENAYLQTSGLFRLRRFRRTPFVAPTAGRGTRCVGDCRRPLARRADWYSDWALTDAVGRGRHVSPNHLSKRVSVSRRSGKLAAAAVGLVAAKPPVASIA